MIPYFKENLIDYIDNISHHKMQLKHALKETVSQASRYSKLDKRIIKNIAADERCLETLKTVPVAELQDI